MCVGVILSVLVISLVVIVSWVFSGKVEAEDGGILMVFTSSVILVETVAEGSLPLLRLLDAFKVPVCMPAGSAVLEGLVLK